MISSRPGFRDVGGSNGGLIHKCLRKKPNSKKDASQAPRQCRLDWDGGDAALELASIWTRSRRPTSSTYFCQNEVLPPYAPPCLTPARPVSTAEANSETLRQRPFDRDHLVTWSTFGLVWIWRVPMKERLSAGTGVMLLPPYPHPHPGRWPVYLAWRREDISTDALFNLHLSTFALECSVPQKWPRTH